MFSHSEPDWMSPSGTFLWKFCNIHFMSSHTCHQTVKTQHIACNSFTSPSGHSFWVFFTNSNTFSYFLYLSLFIAHSLWISEIAVNIEFQQLDMGRNTKLRTKSGREHPELCLHQIGELQQETCENVVEAPYSLRLVVMVFILLIAWHFLKSEFVFYGPTA